MENNSKRKGIISILIIAVCLCLCIGATYAYFTDSATSSGNKIQAGKLKIDLELLNKDTLIWNSIKESQDPIFYHEKWEPGYTDVKLLKVDNEETLAIKWEAKFIYEGQLPALANAIEVYVKTSDSEFAYPTSRDDLDFGWVSQGTLAEFANNISTILNGELLSGESDYFGIALYMPTTVEDNTLQGEAIDPFDIQILATQLSYESDAFDEKYDENAGSSNGGVTPPGETESESDTTTSSSEPDPTDTSSEEPTDEIEPTDSSLFTWDVYDDYAVVTGLKNPGTIAEINIPSTYNGFPVTAIGDDAFRSDSAIESVTIPEGVTTIGDYAFAYCSNLQDVTVPDSITYVGSAFYGCNSLKYNAFDNAYYLGNDVNECVVLMQAINTSITSCDIHDNTKVIYDSAFYDCDGLTNIDIPNNVAQIGCASFSECSHLKNITIPGSVIIIDTSAFTSCADLQSVIICDGVTTIGHSAFRDCYSLTNIEIPDSIVFIDDDAFNFANNIVYNKYENCYYLGNNSNPYVVLMGIIDGSITLCDINENTKVIGNYAFIGWSNLTSIVIPDSIVTIGNYAFMNCSNLTSVTFDENSQLTTICEWAFSDCSGLTSIVIPDSVTTIGEFAFDGCSNLTSVTFGENSQLTTIDNKAFYECSGLTSIEIPNSVTTIGDYAFFGCSNLTSVTIGDSVTTIGDHAFYDCYNLTNITFDGTIEQWNSIDKEDMWDYDTGEYTIYCTDGTIAKDGTVTYY